MEFIKILFSLKLIIVISLLQILIFAAADDDQSKTAPVLLEVHNVSIKCGECPCVNPCNQMVSPPPPPSPSPPPPMSAKNCPPQTQTQTQTKTPPPPRFTYYPGPPEQSIPPPPRFTYVTGPPGNDLYPTDDPFNPQIDSKATRNCIQEAALIIIFVGCGLLQILLLS